LYAACIGNALRIARHAVEQLDPRFESRRYQLLPDIAAGLG